MSDLPVALRPGRKEDFGFIVSSWRETFKLSGRGVEGADLSHVHEELTRTINRILPRSDIRIACDEKDPDVIVGFAVYDGASHELHFTYVRKDFRRLGLARLLLDGLGIQRFTFSTSPGERRLRPRERGWAYTPRWTF